MAGRDAANSRRLGGEDSHPDYSDLPYGSLGLPQYSTEAVLEQHLNTFGVAVERETTLLSLTQTPEGVRVVLQKSYNPEGINMLL